MILTWENKNILRKTSFSANLSTTNPTWTDREQNLDLRGGRPVANRLRHGTFNTKGERDVEGQTNGKKM